MEYSKASILGGVLSALFPFVLWRFGNALGGIFMFSYAIFIIFVNILGIYFCKKNKLKGIEFSILGLIIVIGIIAFLVFVFFTMPPF